MHTPSHTCRFGDARIRHHLGDSCISEGVQAGQIWLSHASICLHRQWCEGSHNLVTVTLFPTLLAILSISHSAI
jgi:hypothetical protein